MTARWGFPRTRGDRPVHIGHPDEDRRRSRFPRTRGDRPVAQRLDPGDGKGQSLRRSRSTWLAAHLNAETPLSVLREVAGPLSTNTLDGILAYTINTLDDAAAVMGALGP